MDPEPGSVCIPRHDSHSSLSSHRHDSLRRRSPSFSYDHISSAYSVDPAESKTMIYEQVGKNFPDAAPGELDAVLGWTR